MLEHSSRIRQGLTPTHFFPDKADSMSNATKKRKLWTMGRLIEAWMRYNQTSPIVVVFGPLETRHLGSFAKG